jgi:hypothetical protein
VAVQQPAARVGLAEAAELLDGLPGSVPGEPVEQLVA